MLDIQVIDDPAAATVALEPMRSRLLAELAAPASAATLATRVGLARQKVNYHLHALEAAERTLGVPTLSAAAATARSILRALDLDPAIPGFGSFLAQPQEATP